LDYGGIHSGEDEGFIQRQVDIDPKTQIKKILAQRWNNEQKERALRLGFRARITEKALLYQI